MLFAFIVPASVFAGRNGFRTNAPDTRRNGMRAWSGLQAGTQEG